MRQSSKLINAIAGRAERYGRPVIDRSTLILTGQEA
jgi:hypothetical protein